MPETNSGALIMYDPLIPMRPSCSSSVKNYILTSKIWDWIFLFRPGGDMNVVRGRNGKIRPKDARPSWRIAVFRFCSAPFESLRYLGIGGLSEYGAIPEISAIKM